MWSVQCPNTIIFSHLFVLHKVNNLLHLILILIISPLYIFNLNALVTKC